MGIKNQIVWRIYVAFGLICLFGLAVIFQSFRVQVVQGERYRMMADSLTTAYRSIEPERGNIRSADDRLLATSLPFFEIRFDPNSDALSDDLFEEHVKDLAKQMAKQFADKTSEDYEIELRMAREKGSRFHLIKRKATYPELQRIKRWPLFNLGKYKGGLIVIQRNKRINPFRMLAHRTIGYVREGVQPVGIEGAYDSILAGVPGKRLMQKIAGGTWIPINDDNEIEPVKGLDLISTLDVNLQDMAESALLKALIKHQADHGSVILMEVATGKIKAIANLGKTENGEYWETYNYAVGESSEPGSTFKLAAMMALLGDGYVNIMDSVDLEKGKKKYYTETIKDSEDHDYRNVTVKRAFEISSNVGISKLINEHYKDKPAQFIKHLRRMGLDKMVGIEIKGEPSPLIKTAQHKDWSGVSLPFMSIGYEVRLTPLQLLTFYNAIPNEGRMVKPYMISEIRDPEFGAVVKEFKPVTLNKRIASKQTLADMQQLLEGVVETGTARRIRTPRYKIAGKTGTAQIADRKHGYQKVYQSSFIGYFPADNPMYSMSVVINAPRSGAYYGSVVAAPVFREISDKVYAGSTNMHPAINRNDTLKDQVPYTLAGHAGDARKLYDELEVTYRQEAGAQWVVPEKKGETITLKERKVVKGLVPDVTGMGLKDALYILNNAGLQVSVVGKGRVRKQSLKIGSRIVKGSAITIELS
jgi:cell division protein FtsI (penicillin-binding protein 3)